MTRINKNNLDSFYSDNLWLEGRTIYLGANHLHAADSNYDADEISPYSSESVIKSLAILDAQNQDKPITIILNSPGGDLAQGLAIYDRIKECESLINIKAYGQCYSAASIILQAADVRSMSPNCLLMVHDGEDCLVGSPDTVYNWAKISRYQTQLMYQIYANASNKTVAYWQKRCKQDYIMTAEQAVKEGLVDNISG